MSDKCDDPDMHRIIAAILSVALIRGAASAETITWMTTDLPPLFIQSGDLAGKGMADLQTAYLMRHLPQFAHRTDDASFPRIWHDIGIKDGICTVGALRSAGREAKALFSNRPVLVPDYRVAVDNRKLPRMLPYLTEAGELDLEKLEADPALRGAYVTARLHSTPIDGFIDSPNRRAPLDKLVSTLQVFHLLHLGRVDFVFALPFEINYYKQISHYTEDISILPIKDSPRSVKAYIACSAQHGGRDVIAAIDALLSRDDNWAEYLTPLKRWLPPADFAAAMSARPGD